MSDGFHDNANFVQHLRACHLEPLPFVERIIRIITVAECINCGVHGWLLRAGPGGGGCDGPASHDRMLAGLCCCIPAAAGDCECHPSKRIQGRQVLTIHSKDLECSA
eukprot:scaffold163747_cov17-Prasinocladus_malaysianus.AAC.3